MGGAIGSLAAYSIASNHSFGKVATKIYLYTFGQPRTGDAEFAKAVDAVVSVCFFVIVIKIKNCSHTEPFNLSKCLK